MRWQPSPRNQCSECVTSAKEYEIELLMTVSVDETEQNGVLNVRSMCKKGLLGIAIRSFRWRVVGTSILPPHKVVDN